MGESVGQRLISLLRRNLFFLVILVAAAIVWLWVFNIAAIDFVSDGTRPFRAVWSGGGEINIFGFTVHVNFEGWADHDYFYHSWAEQFLSGELPYTSEFDTITIDSQTWNVPYFFPPLYLYICVIGKVLHPDIGIGIVLCIFGFLTAFPVYGIGNYLSGNPRVGEAAAATYLLNPIVLYYTVFEWLNPAPFVFFAMLSFYLLMKGCRYSAAIAMTISALFKQTAFFFALPLVAFMLRVPVKSKPNPETMPDSEEKEAADKEDDRIDLIGFAKIVGVVLVYAILVSIPYLFDPLNYAFNVFQRAGAVRLTDFTALPNAGSPITVAVIFVVGAIKVQGTPIEWLGPGLQWIAQVLDAGTYYSVTLLIGMVAVFVLMLFEVKKDREIKQYWRRMFYLSLLLILWIHIFSPRGIYKYYTVVFVPFFSILAVSAMCKRESQEVKVSFPMIVTPFILAIAIMVPDRNLYLLYLILIFIGYVLHNAFSDTYRLAANPITRIIRRIRTKVVIQRTEDAEFEAPKPLEGG